MRTSGRPRLFSDCLAKQSFMEKSIEPPKVGDVIYVDTELFIGHGKDDFCGGKATVTVSLKTSTNPANARCSPADQASGRRN